MIRASLTLACAMLFSVSLLHAVEPASLSDTDRAFIKSACEYQMMEIKNAEQASKRTLTEDERVFSKRMITDHTQAKNELGKIAQKKGYTLPSMISVEQQEKINDVNKVEDSEFNESYLEMSITCHKELIDLYEEQKDDTKDEDLKAYAAKQLVIVKNHLETAKQLEAKY